MKVEEPFPAMIWPHAITSAIAGFPATGLPSSFSSDERLKRTLNVSLIFYTQIKDMCSVLLTESIIIHGFDIGRQISCCMHIECACSRLSGRYPAKDSSSERCCVMIGPTR